MSETGFHWEGFFRALQGDIWSTVWVLICVTVGFFLFRFFVKKANADRSNDEPMMREARKWSRIALLFVIALQLSILAFKAGSYAMANRMLRSDVDKSGVYEQMDSTASESGGK